ncbi:glycosyltransferase [Streptomyces sp. NPDC055808]
MNGPTVLFGWRRTPPPLLVGGAEVSQQLLAEEFAAAGWTTVYIGSFEPPWNARSQLDSLRAHLAPAHVPFEEAAEEMRYRWNGVDCMALSQHRLERAFSRAIQALSPQLVITSQERAADLAALARRSGHQVAGWLHSVSPTSQNVLQGRPHVALATSRFVADRIHPAPETKTVVYYPPFRPPSASADKPLAFRPGLSRSPAGGLLMVNPVPAKGSALLHDLVQLLPAERFTLVEGWWDTASDFARYPNVNYVPRTYDMGPLYASHRLLLVPSVVEDAFPRVIVEAALHGCPALGSRRGGIPEAIAGGGLLLAHDDVGAWAKAIEGREGETPGGRARERALPLVRACLPELAAFGLLG